MLAPIVLFTYNRLWHAQQTIKSLQNNDLAKKSELFIYSDGGKDEKSWKKVNEIRKYLKTVHGFKNINLIFQEKNIGLANSIISGVTEIINKYEKIIVLEDDMVTSPYFLDFMNNALDFYENTKKVWQIGGWFFPIKNDDLDDIILHQAMNCWGWGTWKDRWVNFKKEPQNLINHYTKEDIFKFNMYGNDKSLWGQVIANSEKRINSWAIFWHEIIYKNHGLYVNPKNSIVKNIGTDGSGIHHGNYDYFGKEIDFKKSFYFNKDLVVNKLAMCRISIFFNELYNNNYIYSLQTNKIFKYLDKLNDIDCTFILYGTGTGMELILCKLQRNKILFAVDQDKIKQNTIKDNIKIYSPAKIIENKFKNSKILITVFGRENEIKRILINEFKIDENHIISLDILND